MPRATAAHEPAAARLRVRHTLEAVFGAVALASVAMLGLGVHLDPGNVADRTAVAEVHHAAAHAGGGVAHAVADLAASGPVLVLTILCALCLVARRHWHGALALTVSVATCQGLVALVKHVVARDRPPGEDALVDAAGYSFPSAHSATSVALYGLLALVAEHELRGRVPRAWAMALAGVLCIGVGLSRVYLGAHYPTDVLAGWLLGSVIALGSWRGALALHGRLAPSPA